MDNEFLLYLNSQIITDDYSDEFINTILKFIKEDCKADLVMLIDLESQRKDDFKTHDKGVQTEDGDFTVCLSACHKKLIIRGKKREFQNDKYFRVSLSVILGNMFKNKAIVEKLKREKYLDSTLKVYNRRAYNEVLHGDKREFQNVGILFVDANGLGILNNMYSYQKGDELLKTVSGSLKSNFRLSDIYRIGGDEFVVICESIAKELFERKASQAKKSIEETEFTASFGLVYKESTNDLEGSVEEASFLMKRNKEEFRETHPEIYLDKYKVKQVVKN